MNIVNQKIINAIIEKAESLYPDSLALIGVYGSVATGDEYEKSDLDLLILIQDDEGRKLGTGFTLNDSGIGYDIYCTDWNGLCSDAECHYAHISKLMDSKVIYVKNQKVYDELCKLREQTKLFLASQERFQRVNELVNKAKVSYTDSLLHDKLGEVRLDAFDVMHCLADAVMFYHGKYFKLGVKRTFEEISNLPVEEEFSANMKKISASKDISEIRALLKCLLLYVESHIRQDKHKEEPSLALSGTYEEMYSNWRNKVEEAAINGDVYSSFVNMCCFHYMLSDISSEINIGDYNIMEEYNPEDLTDNIRIYDKYLKKYEKVCNKAGITIRRFSDVDAFVTDYAENGE